MACEYFIYKLICNIYCKLVMESFNQVVWAILSPESAAIRFMRRTYLPDIFMVAHAISTAYKFLCNFAFRVYAQMCGKQDTRGACFFT